LREGRVVVSVDTFFRKLTGGEKPEDIRDPEKVRAKMRELWEEGKQLEAARWKIEGGPGTSSCHPNAVRIAERQGDVERERQAWGRRLTLLERFITSPAPPLEAREQAAHDVVSRLEGLQKEAEQKLSEAREARAGTERDWEETVADGRAPDREAIEAATAKEREVEAELRRTTGALMRAKTRLVEVRKKVRHDAEERTRDDSRRLLGAIAEHALIAADAMEALGRLNTGPEGYAAPPPLRGFTRERLEHFLRFSRQHLGDVGSGDGSGPEAA
jgi:hypothetical protein